MPVDAPTITRAEVVATGGELTLVDGLISDAGRLVGAAVTAGDGWFDAGTLKEPYRIEGKKTMGFEIAEQLGWRMPDVIIYPTGGGVGLIGIHKALTELVELGWLDRSRCPGWWRCSRRAARRSCAPSTPGRASRSCGRTRAPSRSASPCPRRSATSWCSTRSTRPVARLSRSRTPTCWPTWLLAGRLEGMFLCPEGAATVTAARGLRGGGLDRRRRRGRAAQHRRRRALPRRGAGRCTRRRENRVLRT